MINAFSYGWVAWTRCINKYIPNYTTLQCSCIVCKKPKTSKGIHSHYLIAHTIEGREKNRKNRLAGGLLGAAIIKQTARQRNQKKEKQYLKNPSKCDFCQTLLPYPKRTNKFCSRSCSAKFFNTDRKNVPLSKVTKQKISKGVKIVSTQNPYLPKYCKVSFCVICNSVIRNKHLQSCSKNCTKELISSKIIERIKTNRRSNYQRGKMSYLEESFIKWLQSNNIDLKYISEYTIKNHITNKWYFVDFYFPDINLVVELDGKQHEKPKHKEADILRDEYIQRYLNIQVFRISHDEYQKGIKIQSLLEMLVPRQGTDPCSPC